MADVFNSNPKRYLSMPALPRAFSTDVTPLITRSDPSVQYSIFKKRSDSFHLRIAPFLPDPPCLCPCVCVSKYLQMSDMDAIAGGIHNKQETLTYFASKFDQFENCDISELLLELLYEGLRFARKNELDKRKTVSLLNILYMTNKYFTTSPWRRSFETYNFLKESLLLHTVMRPPKSTEIFTPQECKDALIHFTREYISNLPLVHLTTLPSYHIHFKWEDAPVLDLIVDKEQQKENKESDRERRENKRSRTSSRSRSILK